MLVKNARLESRKLVGLVERAVNTRETSQVQPFEMAIRDQQSIWTGRVAMTIEFKEERWQLFRRTGLRSTHVAKTAQIKSQLQGLNQSR